MAIGIMVGYLVGGMFVLNFGTAHWLVIAVYLLQTLRGLLEASSLVWTSLAGC